ncbi:MAG TPA: SAM-dependent methyltransferase [Thermoanaerobaculia bacterium]|nr:SAM-dependent methyltransferase [Thermoanaerobaculia bacterium]
MRRDRPSRTAVQVARVVVLLAHEERYAALLPPDLAEAVRGLLIAAGALKERHLRRFRAGWYQRFAHWSEKLAEPGHFLHLGLRKRWVEDETVAALEAGAAQVLVMGAGMDTLALRLAPRFPEVAFVELDHPASQRAKQRAMERAAGEIGGVPANLRFLAADLAAGVPLGETLAACDAWRPTARSVVVAEGLLMYLAEPVVRAVFEALRGVTGPGSRVLFSYVSRWSDGRLDLGKRSRLLSAVMKLAGEPIVWGTTEDELPGYLAGLGYRLGGGRERFDLRSRYLKPAGLGDEALGTLEGVAVAERI